MAKKKKKSNIRPVQAQIVPAGGNFWTHDDKRSFYEAVTQLPDIPDGPPQSYRMNLVKYCVGYVLTLHEELQLADDIAFLFPWEEKADTVTASSIEEHDKGQRLVIRLAVNELPPPGKVIEFRDLMNIVERYATRALDRKEAFEELLDKVVETRSKRILQRLQSPNGGRTPGRACEPLYERLARKLAYLKNTIEHFRPSKLKRKEFGAICRSVEDLLKVYRAVDTCTNHTRHTCLRSAVEASHKLSARSSQHHLLLQQLAALGFRWNDIEVNHLLQVDKLNGYHSFCTNILSLACRHRELFSNIEVAVCHRPPDSRPPGSIETCHVHGEVQLVLHHERVMHQPKPRCIGSSKSLCFLCGLFVQTHGEYQVSHNHKRLYRKWTVPDTNWMNDEQALRFQRIARQMTAELVRLGRLTSIYVPNFPPESLPRLPFTASPSVSSLTSSIASVDSDDGDETIRQGLSQSGSLTPVLEGQPDRNEGGPEQRTSTAPDQLSRSTLTEEIAAESVFLLSSPPHFELPSVTEDHPQTAAILPSTPPPTSPILNADSQQQASSPVSISPIQSLGSPLPPSSSLPALPIITLISPQQSPIPNLPVPPSHISPTSRISSASSLVLSTPPNLPQTHNFHSRSHDLELTISQTLFIFEFGFETTVIGTLMLSQIHTNSTTGPISLLDGSGICQVINAAEMGREAVRFKMEERRCEFAVCAGQVEAVRIVVVWEDM